MKSKVIWSEQVEHYVKSKAPDPRRELWRQIRALADWDGKEDPSHMCHLEDELSGYSRIRMGHHRVIFRESFIKGKRIVACAFAGPRETVYEAFAELLLDELASKHPSAQGAA